MKSVAIMKIPCGFKIRKKVDIEKLWGMISRIDTKEKAIIAEDFVRQCDLTNEEFDDLMMAISYCYREFSKA